MALGAMSKPPSCADVRDDPPLKSLEHGERARDSKMAWGGGVAFLDYPRSQEKREVNSRRLVVEQASCTPAGRAWTGGRGGVRFPHQQKGAVVIPVEVSFVG